MLQDYVLFVHNIAALCVGLATLYWCGCNNALILFAIVVFPVPASAVM